MDSGSTESRWTQLLNSCFRSGVLLLRKGYLLRKAPPIGVKNFLGGGGFLIIRNLEIGRRPENLSILSRKMKEKRVFRAFGAPQAPKIFAYGAKKPYFFSILVILEYRFSNY